MTGSTGDARALQHWGDLVTGLTWLTAVIRRAEDIVSSYEQTQASSTLAGAPQGLRFLLIAPRGLGRFRFAGELGSVLFNRGHMNSPTINTIFAEKLVSRWIGQTRPTTLEACQTALNGMLMIQYAGDLAGQTFSREAVDTLTEFMDANNSSVITMIIDPHEMPAFAALYPELVRRFHKIEFPLPCLREQSDFLRKLAKQHNCRLPYSYVSPLEDLLGPWIERRMLQNDWQYMRQIGHLLAQATIAWAERTGAPRDPQGRFQFPDAVNLDRVDFESAIDPRPSPE
jgi:hypothetical protein